MSKIKKTTVPPSFSALVQTYFTEYLTQQRALSPHTVAAYRDAFMLFLEFATSRLDKSPTEMAMTDITPELIINFLDHLENQRHNSVRSRNVRLAALLLTLLQTRGYLPQNSHTSNINRFFHFGFFANSKSVIPQKKLIGSGLILGNWYKRIADEIGMTSSEICGRS